MIKKMSRNCRCVKFVNQRSLTTRQKSREFSASREWASLRRFLRRMLQVLRHDEGHWYWQKAATSYNQKMIRILNEIFDFWIIQSQAAKVNCLYVARFTILHSKRQMKFPFNITMIIIIIIIIIITLFIGSGKKKGFDFKFFVIVYCL